jgi:radical SAM protein with 4Fe4S-binding SPASM domain
MTFSQMINPVRHMKRMLGVRLLAEKDTDKLIERAQVSKYRSLGYKLGSQFLIDREFPLHLYLELSRTCNYRCPMCMRSDSARGGHFPEDLARKIVKEAAQKGPTSYSLHLYGEPLMNPNWWRIVELIRKADPHNAILLTTNGSLLDKTNCQKLLDLRVNRIFLSMHSLDPATYRRNTGGGDIDKIWQNIKTFNEMNVKRGKTKNTKLYVRLFRGPNDAPVDEKVVADLKKDQVGVEIRGYHNFAGGKSEWSTFKKFEQRWPCYHPWFTLGVAVDGSITICCADAKMGLTVGNAYETSLENIWKSDAVTSIRDEHMSLKFKKWKTCDSCDIWQFHPNFFSQHQMTLNKH